MIISIYVIHTFEFCLPPLIFLVWFTVAIIKPLRNIHDAVFALTPPCELEENIFFLWLVHFAITRPPTCVLCNLHFSKVTRRSSRFHLISRRGKIYFPLLLLLTYGNMWCHADCRGVIAENPFCAYWIWAAYSGDSYFSNKALLFTVNEALNLFLKCIRYSEAYIIARIVFVSCTIEN